MDTISVLGPLHQLDDETRGLIEKAKEALPHAYAPYSRFHVAAALLLSDDLILTGTNQENAAYPDCMCAERVALYAQAALYPNTRIRRMAVVARQGSAARLSPASCCGSCRQVMLEFEQRQGQTFDIIFQHTEGTWLRASSAASLLPYGFDAGALQRQ